MHAKDRTLSSAPSEEGPWDKLPDSVIKEILLRLPNFSLLGFFSISKPWLSLTTSRYFLQRWGLQYAPFHHDPPLALLFQNSSTWIEGDFFLCSGVPEVKISGFSLDFLPKPFLTCLTHHAVMGSCEDLLCAREKEYQIFYYVVNPITHQWVRLTIPRRIHKCVLSGFICDLASIAEARKGGELRYRVVRIPIDEYSITKLKVEILSSEDGQWNDYVMTVAEGLTSHSCIRMAVACNVILYWHFDCGGVQVMGLDPFNPEKKGIHVIQNAPDRFDAESKNHVLRICQGKLRMSKMILSVALSMNIWELDVGKAKWQLVHKVRLQEIVAANLSIVHPSTAVGSSWRTLAFHTCNTEIVYFYLECNEMNKVISCDLKRKSLEIESDYDFNKSCGRCFDVILFPLLQRSTRVPGSRC